MKPSANKIRKHRHNRMRYYIKGTAEIPRLNVFRSERHFYAQIIDDKNHKTLCACNTLQIASLTKTSNKEAAATVGKLIAKKALKQKITKVIFDRGGYLYHGKIKAFVEAARENGLVF